MTDPDRLSPLAPVRPAGEPTVPGAAEGNSFVAGPQPTASQAGQGGSASPAERRPKHQFRREKRDVHGWVVLDKPVGMTSTQAVGAIKRLFKSKTAGHAGTLDPLASGCLPVAMGEATKTVPFVMDGRKSYRFTVRWGEERDTDDAEGRVTGRSDRRPGRAEIEALLPAFTGAILQVPPQYSAIKVAGERAYDLARDGEAVELKARPVQIDRLTLLAVPDAERAEFEAECGKGTYVRSLARDMGRALGCLGHIEALRRQSVGGMGAETMISLEQLSHLCDRAARQTRPGFKEARPFCCADGMPPSSAARFTSRHRAVSWPLPKWTVARSSPGACST
jgi:tRNA pseudouridine55 synthase